VNDRVLAEDDVERSVPEPKRPWVYQLIVDAIIELQVGRTIGSEIDQALLDVDAQDRLGKVVPNEDDIHSTASDIEDVAPSDVVFPDNPEGDPREGTNGPSPVP
jgi:hypothetical protein